MTEPNMKTCPVCAEEVKSAAKKCKHCGERLTPTAHQERQIGEWMHCPECGSAETEVAGFLTRLMGGAIASGLFLILLLIVSPILLVVPVIGPLLFVVWIGVVISGPVYSIRKPAYECKACGHQWNKQDVVEGASGT